MTSGRRPPTRMAAMPPMSPRLKRRRPADRNRRFVGGVGVAALFTLGVIVVRLDPMAKPVTPKDEKPQVTSSKVRTASYVLDCSTESSPINPMIYGTGGGQPPWALNATARRWGGNPTTRYNWELNTWNLAKDWFFKNVGGKKNEGYENFLNENVSRGVETAFTVPTIGWVAKDATSYGFPIAEFGTQEAHAPELPDAGNGVAPNGKPIQPGPPTRTSVASTPETIERWVRRIRELDQSRGARSVDTYILDNEPSLWNSTHRDVHPDAVGYDELLERTLAYAAAIRRADPAARIAGPAEWGWLGYHYSAKDVEATVALRPDRRLHGDVPLIPWYLKKIQEYEQKTKTKILDLVDVHFYPMGDRIGIGEGGDTDPATAAKRIRSTRSLWDPNYLDESWINERMQILPMLKRWIAENRPGLGISIGEWNFGAETHVSGGLAVAETLGRFGVHGVSSAYYWTVPPENSPAFWAFRAYRNFDGAGGRFLDWSIPAKGDAALSSLFGSRDADRKKLVAILLNFAPVSPLNAKVALQACGTVALARGFSYAGGNGAFTAVPLSSTPSAIEVNVQPYSITVLDLATAPVVVGLEK